MLSSLHYRAPCLFTSLFVIFSVYCLNLYVRYSLCVPVCYPFCPSLSTCFILQLYPLCVLPSLIAILSVCHPLCVYSSQFVILLWSLLTTLFVIIFLSYPLFMLSSLCDIQSVYHLWLLYSLCYILSVCYCLCVSFFLNIIHSVYHPKIYSAMTKQFQIISRITSSVCYVKP